MRLRLRAVRHLTAGVSYVCTAGGEHARVRVAAAHATRAECKKGFIVRRARFGGASTCRSK